MPNLGSRLNSVPHPAGSGTTTLRQKLAALSSVPKFLRLAWETHSGFGTATLLLRLLRAGIPVASLWVAKLIIDTVVAARMGRPNISRLGVLIAVEVVIVASGEALDRASAAVEALFGDLCANRIGEKLIAHAGLLDLHHFEDPGFYDRMERAQRQTTGRIGLLTQLLSLGQDSVTLISLASAVLFYSPWLLALLVAAILPGFFGELHFSTLEYSLLYRMTPERRRLDYLRSLSASDNSAKEVQMFGLSAWLLGRYRKLSSRLHDANSRLALRKGIAAILLSWLGLAGYYAGYIIILWRGFYGVISVGTVIFLSGSFLRCRTAMESVLLSVGNIYEQSLYVRDLFDFFELQPTVISRPGSRPVSSRLQQGLVFEDVGFQYPGSHSWAVRHINFHMAPGEKIALVGENGAGKTTLTKLLARLYDPTEGRILLDGVDLREYELASLRNAIGVIFQDFVRYDLTLNENIGVGEIHRVQQYLDDLLEQPNDQVSWSTDPAIAEAAEKSQAASLVESFPLGYRQMLGRRFENGLEISGGEWQKIALARAYIRHAKIIILDEPTAALDARAEYETFRRFAELAAGQITVLISHRFSTVRMADRIIVLQRGVITEEGTHDQLLSANGIYAELFQLQAEGYR
ncbi:MAG TPA: ABC transporter ATP-binding protein [Candidatus Angelobacter sp.]|nr:ABC transporter ATP-binding protein [Candidatus Angelobacter sp.]